MLSLISNDARVLGARPLSAASTAVRRATDVAGAPSGTHGAARTGMGRNGIIMPPSVTQALGVALRTERPKSASSMPARLPGT
jgi:hypothetical protein